MPSALRMMLMIGRVVAVPAPQSLMDALQTVQVTRGVDQGNGFQLTFAVSKRSVITQALLPAGMFDPGARVIIVAIVGGVPDTLMDGIVTRQEVSPSDDPGGSTLTVTGDDVSNVMDRRQVREAHLGEPAEAQVAKICVRPEYVPYGIVPLPIPTVITNVPNPLEFNPIEANMTDLEYLQSLAFRNGYTFYIEPGPTPGLNIAYWGPEIRAGLVQPALNVNMDAATNVESLSFSFDGMARTQFTITVTEPNTKIPIPIPVPDISLLRPPLALRPAVALKEENLPNTSGRRVADVLLCGLSESTRSTDVVSGQGKLDVLRYGRALKSRHLVGVRGAGLAYDGLYFVKSVTHELKRGEYKQSFSLSRDGLVSLTPQVLP
jgi:hypothetical protein